MTILADGETAPMSTTGLIGEMELLIPMAGLIDVAAEMARIDKQRKTRPRSLASKANVEPRFCGKSSAEVIDKGAKMTDLKRDMDKLNEQKSEFAKVRSLSFSFTLIHLL